MQRCSISYAAQLNFEREIFKSSTLKKCLRTDAAPVSAHLRASPSLDTRSIQSRIELLFCLVYPGTGRRSGILLNHSPRSILNPARSFDFSWSGESPGCILLAPGGLRTVLWVAVRIYSRESMLCGTFQPRNCFWFFYWSLFQNFGDFLKFKENFNIIFTLHPKPARAARLKTVRSSTKLQYK